MLGGRAREDSQPRGEAGFGGLEAGRTSKRRATECHVRGGAQTAGGTDHVAGSERPENVRTGEVRVRGLSTAEIHNSRRGDDSTGLGGSSLATGDPLSVPRGSGPILSELQPDSAPVPVDFRTASDPLLRGSLGNGNDVEAGGSVRDEGAGHKEDEPSDTTQYQRVVEKAGCSPAVSNLPTKCALAPRKTVLLREWDGEEYELGAFYSIEQAHEAAEAGDIIEQWGHAKQAWFSLTKPITLRGHPEHPALLQSDWPTYQAADGQAGFDPFILIEPSASGLRLGPNLIINSKTNREGGRKTASIFVADTTKNVVLDHVIVVGDASGAEQREDSEEPGNFGVFFGEQTSGQLLSCQVSNNTLTGVVARPGTELTLRDCQVSANGEAGVWGQTSTTLILKNCTVSDTKREGISSQGSKLTVSDCLVSNNYVGIDLYRPEEGTGPMPVGHVLANNHITGNFTGVEVFLGVPATLTGNVVDNNEEVGLLMDQPAAMEGEQLASLRQTLCENNALLNNQSDQLRITLV